MKVLLSAKANKQLLSLPPRMYSLVFSRIEALGASPFPSQSKKLAGREGWRLRVGDYRILYTTDIKKRELTILSVAHRKEAYRL